MYKVYNGSLRTSHRTPYFPLEDQSVNAVYGINGYLLLRIAGNICIHYVN
jgi:hypothetical protein